MEIPENLPCVKADVNHMETALLNLAVNARDAMPQGGTITIAADLVTFSAVPGAAALNDECVVLSVSDTGEGMDPETLARATEPFFTTKGVGKGTGLGLSMVHGMAEQLGGRLRVESQRGNGTKVEIWLPLAEGPSPETAVELPVSLPEPADRTLTIVLVDDDELVLVNAKAMLEDLGHIVHEATSAAQALEIVQKVRRVDLVITDQAMPQMTGLQLAAAIKVERPDLPVLLVSGYAELPTTSYFEIPKLAKPFSLDDLENAVVSAVKAKN
jgi:CheY-like chemotaxis protein